MNLPPFFLGFVLLFWGWHTGLWWLGVPLGLLTELARVLPTQWEFELKERQRVGDLCTILVLISGGYLYFTQPHSGDVVILIMQWAPALFFPLLAMQIYGGRDNVELSVLFLSLRGDSRRSNEQVDLRPAYLIVCLVAAAMTPPPGTFYYICLGFIIIWLLLYIRPNNFKLWRWGAVLAIAFSIGYGVSNGLVRLQLTIEDVVLMWMVGSYNSDIDPYKGNTAIGEIGELKLSEEIVLRVWPDLPLSTPLLLHRAIFTKYRAGIWSTERTQTQALVSGTKGWWLTTGVGELKRWVKITLPLNQGRGVLPLPNGSGTLQGLSGAQIGANRAGIVSVTEGPGLASYRVEYAGTSTANLPATVDLQVPETERVVLQQLVQDLNLHGVSATTTIERIGKFFQDKFHYSLKLDARNDSRTALADFLTRSRTGHCEYFASAAVLLLRQAGIPARYVTGWSIQEYSELERAYVGRSRHGHAWAMVWVNGAWHNFDPTPTDWNDIETQERPWWGGMHDLWAWFKYRINNQDPEKHANNPWLIAGLVILIAILAWRIARRGRYNAKVAKLEPLDTEKPTTIFTPIERVLELRNGARNSGETLRAWLKRLQLYHETAIAELLPALDLYYQQRFDPRGINAQDALRLQTLLNQWLERYSKPIVTTWVR